MDWIFPILALLCVGITVVYLWRKHRVNRGERCWNCGGDLSGENKGSYICPECGHETEIDE
jgi:rRNA maturation endonuclease Nob1